MALLDELEEKIKLNPYAREFYQLALEYQKIGKFSEAKAVLIRGLERNQGNFQARLLLTKIFVAEGNFKEAKNQIDRVLLIVPDNVAANHLAAEISEALGDKKGALKYYRVVELFEPEREGIKEKISELTNQELKDEKITEEKIAEEVQNVEVSEQQAKAEEIFPPKIKEEKIEEKEESKEKVEEIISEKENIEEFSSVSDFPQIKKEENLSEESSEESGDSFEEVEKREEDFTQSETAFDNQRVLDIEEEAYEDVGEDTLTDLLEDTVHQTEKDQEQPQEEITESKEEIEVKESSETVDKEPAGEMKSFIEETEVAEEEEKVEASSLSTATLAELYEKQGYPDKAIEIYQHILLKDPDREEIKKKIEKLKKEMLGMETSEDVGVVDVKSALRGKRIEALKTWLKRIREADNV